MQDGDPQCSPLVSQLPGMKVAEAPCLPNVSPHAWIVHILVEQVIQETLDSPLGQVAQCTAFLSQRISQFIVARVFAHAFRPSYQKASTTRFTIVSRGYQPLFRH